MRRLVLALSAGLALGPVLGLVPGLAAPAAAEGQLVVSADGVAWSPSLPGPVLGVGGPWVPGDVRAGGFWVRNDAGEPGTLSVAVTAEDPAALLGHDDVTVEARRGGGTWTALPADAALHPLDGRLVPAATDRVEVRATFRATSPNRSQRTALRLRFTVALTAANVAPPDDGGAPAAPGLPDTGGFRRVLVVVGVLLVLAGLLLLGAGPRREKETREKS